MACDFTDLHVAKKKMELKKVHACYSFVSTLWKGEVIMCCFNTLNKEISDLYCVQVMQPDDISQLELLIQEFIYGG